MKLPKRLGCLEEHRDLPQWCPEWSPIAEKWLFYKLVWENKRQQSLTDVLRAAPLQCSARHCTDKKSCPKTFPYGITYILVLFARSVNYTRVIQANQLLTPVNRDIDVSTRVTWAANRDVPLKSERVATLRMTTILNTSIAPTTDDKPMPWQMTLSCTDTSVTVKIKIICRVT